MRSGKALDWHHSPGVAFPRVTMCDFTVRRLGNPHRYTVQCTLPINMYTEKIYMFLWFWFLFVAFMSLWSFITWLLRALILYDRTSYIKNHLVEAKILKKSHDRNDPLHRLAEKFCKSYLRHDGIFLLHLIGHNTNHLIVNEIIAALWSFHETKRIKYEGDDKDHWYETTREYGFNTGHYLGEDKLNDILHPKNEPDFDITPELYPNFNPNRPRQGGNSGHRPKRSKFRRGRRCIIM